VSYLYLDIETVEAQREDIRARILQRTMKDYDKTDGAIVDEIDRMEVVDRLYREALAKTSLDGAFGEIACIAAAVDDRPVKAWWRNPGESERDLLAGFRDDVRAIVRASRDRFVVVGHNVVDFDMRFIRQRGIVHGLAMPSIFTQDIKPWEATGGVAYDTMRAWVGGAKGAISLDNLALALGLPGKGDITGADVGRLWREGQGEKIAIYCCGDVETDRAVHKRMITLE